MEHDKIQTESVEILSSRYAHKSAYSVFAIEMAIAISVKKIESVGMSIKRVHKIFFLTNIDQSQCWSQEIVIVIFPSQSLLQTILTVRDCKKSD